VFDNLLRGGIIKNVINQKYMSIENPTEKKEEQGEIKRARGQGYCISAKPFDGAQGKANSGELWLSNFSEDFVDSNKWHKITAGETPVYVGGFPQRTDGSEPYKIEPGKTCLVRMTEAGTVHNVAGI